MFNTFFFFLKRLRVGLAHTTFPMCTDHTDCLVPFPPHRMPGQRQVNYTLTWTVSLIALILTRWPAVTLPEEGYALDGTTVTCKLPRVAPKLCGQKGKRLLRKWHQSRNIAQNSIHVKVALGQVVQMLSGYP